MSANVRAFLQSELQPLCPSGWVWITEQREPDAIQKTTVVIKHSELEPLSEAGLGNLRSTVTLSVFSPLGTTAKAEDALDDAVIDLTQAIDASDRIVWTRAKKVVSANETYFGWDITLSVTLTKD